MNIVLRYCYQFNFSSLSPKFLLVGQKKKKKKKIKQSWMLIVPVNLSWGWLCIAISVNKPASDIIIFLTRLSMLNFYHCAVEPRYSEVLEIERIALYLVSHCVRVKILRNIRCWERWGCLVVRKLCYIRPLCSEVPLYLTSQTCI